MIPAPFEYLRPATLTEALAILAERGDEAKVLAGGHSLLPMMKLRLAKPELLLDLSAVAELTGIRTTADGLVIGAMTTHAQVANSPSVTEHAPLLAHAAGQVGDPQVRHRGTIGGSLVHADPAADLPMAIVACNATMVIQGASGRREIPADDFFQGPFETAVGPDDILVEVAIPSHRGSGWGYEKFTQRANDWAIVGVATVAGRVVLGGIAGVPLRATAVEDALRDGRSAGQAAALAAADTEPAGDIRANAAYRRHLAVVLTERAILSATGDVTD